nr:hypothetical protein [Myxococcota bacterium]
MGSEFRTILCAVAVLVSGFVASCSCESEDIPKPAVAKVEKACHQDTDPPPDPPPERPEPCVFHVDLDNPTPGDGLSWSTAYTDIQSAVDAAYSVAGGVACEVWVAEGIYHVYQWSPHNLIRMRAYVEIYGGFSGAETERYERDVAAFPTILDGRKASNGRKRVFHVVRGASNAVLDGFTIRHGRAKGGWLAARDGGGLYNLKASPIVRNCSFINNTASDDGAAVYNVYASPEFENCLFINNKSKGDGTVYNLASAPKFTNCVFSGNKVKKSGGAIYNKLGSMVTLINSTLYNNHSRRSGGAIYNRYWSAVEATNTIFWDNTSKFGCGDTLSGPGSYIVTYSDIQGGYAGVGNIDADPLFVDPGAGNLHLSAGSPGIDAANGDVAFATDLEGRYRYDDSLVPNTGVGTPMYVDMGAYEFIPEGDPCEGVVCDTPPLNTCADVDTLTVYETPGACLGGECAYATHTEACEFGCEEGACNPNPCEDVVCDTPPANSCANADTLTVYNQTGTCANGECYYETSLLFCEFGCEDGACLVNPCEGITCTTPPANVCEDADNLRVYEQTGYCENAECFYSYQVSPCAYGCADGACLEDPCAGVTCDAPPANYCEDASTLRAFEPNGTCTDGECEYGFTDNTCEFGCLDGACQADPCANVMCNTPPANFCNDEGNLVVHDQEGVCADGACIYGSLVEVCDFGCDQGACLEDPCIGVTCTNPPADYCNNDGDLVVFDQQGVCENGTCTYAESVEPCLFGCESGECLEDPCLNVVCETPPADYCLDGTTQVTYEVPGTCEGGVCSYVSIEAVCASGICEGGSCATSQMVDCQDVAPENATSTIVQVEITYIEGQGWTEPAECEWSCNAGYHQEGEVCVVNECELGESETGACGLNNNGTRTRDCVDYYWGAWSACDDPDICVNGAIEAQACGLNNRGSQDRTCVAGQWDTWGVCNDPDVCADATTETQACGLNNRGTQDRTCVAGQWDAWEACDDPDVCVDAATETQACGLNNRGSQDRTCVAGQWGAWGACDDLDVCVDAATETQACGLNNRGSQDRTCVAGQWDTWGACDDPDMCVDTATETQACGLNSRGSQDRTCVAGQWEAWGACDDPDVCVDAAAETQACGLNNRGSQERTCVTGQWDAWGACDDPDVCVDAATETQACGLNNRGSQDRTCVAGQWEAWGACDDPDVCVDAATETQACGLNSRGIQERTCVAGHWDAWGVCDDPDVCVDAATENRACGLNNRGSQDRTCVTGQWDPWGECNDPDVCVDAATETLACGLNNRGSQDRTCVAGQWDAWEACDDPDICVDAATETQVCGLNNRGTQERTCVAGQWDAWGACDDPDVCVDAATETQACGLNNRSSQERSCVTGQWDPWGACDDPDVCVDAATETQACGLNNRGSQERTCVAGQWEAWGACNDPDVCVDAATETQACGLNNRGSQERTCVAGHWEAWGACNDPDVCVDAATETQACGLNNRGSQDRTCVNGQWDPWGACNDPDVCVDAATETQACGLNNRGSQDRTCIAGQWDAWEACNDPDVCVDAATETQACGLNNRGSQDRTCVAGQWDTWGACDDPDVCVDAATETQACGLNNRGSQERTCVAGQWDAWGGCDDPDVCVDAVTETQACGLNNRGSQERTCVAGQWEAWGACDDPDVCVDAATETQACGLNNRGSQDRTCVVGQWDAWGACDDPDVCVDAATETQACGLNNRGSQDRTCVAGQWDAWGTCDDPDVCVDAATETQACGLNNRGSQDRTCVAGQWDAWAACDDPDVCVDAATETQACGLNSRGSQDRTCVAGQWEAWGACDDPDVCVDAATETQACGLNNRGSQERACVAGQWDVWGACDDPDVCVDAATETQACGLNSRGSQDRTCVAGQWDTWGACNDSDVCVDAATEAQACGLNNRGSQERTCVAGQWDPWGACNDPDVCVDAATETQACGLNNRGSQDRTCVAGQWEAWGACNDPDVCVDAATETQACGLNNRGSQDRTCVAGQWDAWGACNDPDVCVDAATETQACGLNNRGTQDRTCVTGQWDAWGACDDPDVCVDAATETQTCGSGGLGSQERTCEVGQWGVWGDCVCPVDYVFENGACINSKMVDCVDNPPENATSILEQVEITYTTAGGWTTPADCAWTCNEGYVPSDDVCIVDPCIDVICDTPPDDYCDGDTAVYYEAIGECAGGVCNYYTTQEVCAHGCVNGICNECSAGACCGQDGFILGSDHRCGTDPVDQEFACSHSQCGGDAQRRELYQYCNGTSPTCGMDNIQWEEWETIQSCYTYGFCQTDGSDAWCVNCDLGCAEGACNTDLPPDPATIAPPLDPTRVTRLKEATAFLYTGADPIQKGLDPAIIEEERTVVLRGIVQNKDNTPLAGVTITILDYPEYGSTVTRADGMFDMVANGGSQLIMHYEKYGYLPVQRKIKTPWENYAHLPPVVMIPVDPNVTYVDLTDTSADLQVAQGSFVSDERGDRQGRLLIPSGTTATMEMKDGSTHQIETLDLRITEYTVGNNGINTMPAYLPPTTMYNYAVELSTDLGIDANAKGIRFDQPLYYYIENFHGVPTGASVPVGIYDFEKAAWIPSENGVVVEILDIVDGAAILDIDGDGTGDSQERLDLYGVTDAELAELATSYVVGDTLWRVPIRHFSPIDCNYPFWVPEDAEAPDPEKPEGPLNDPDLGDCEQSGSSIYCFDQALGETIPIPGTGVRLSYNSNRVVGGDKSRRIIIPMQSKDFCQDYWVGGELSERRKLLYAEIEIKVAGKTYRYMECCNEGTCARGAEVCNGPIPREEVCDQDGNPKQLIFDEWDGKTVYGTTPVSPQTARIMLGNVYERWMSYQPFSGSGGEGMVFGGYCSRSACAQYRAFGNTTYSIARLETNLEVSLGALDSKHMGLGGWSLEPHHFFDPVNDVLHRGDGAKVYVDALVPIISQVPYTPDAGELEGTYIKDIAVSPAGEVYYSRAVGYPHDDPGNQGPINIFKIDKQGNHSRVDIEVVDLEDSNCHFLENGFSSLDLKFGHDGDLYIGLNFNGWGNVNSGVFKLTKDNKFIHLGGCGPIEDIDQLPAKEARLINAMDMEIDANGRIYIAETHVSNYMTSKYIRMIDTDGIMRTLFTPEDFPYIMRGTSARMCADAIALGPGNELYALCWYGASEIWKYLPSGEWRWVAGGYPEGQLDDYSIDLVPVGNSKLCFPNKNALLVTDEGTVIWDEASGIGNCGEFGDNNKIKRLIDGHVQTFGGIGPQGSTGDDGPALLAEIDTIRSMALSPNGDLYFSGYYKWLRKISTKLENSIDVGYTVPSQDGTEIYEFNLVGRHLATKDALSGQVKYQFGYNPDGYLMTVTDAEGDILEIERDVTGRITGIMPPAQGSVLDPSMRKIGIELDANDYIHRVVLPDGANYQMTYYDTEGLLWTFTTPNGDLATFTYDDDGRLTTGLDAAGSTKTLQLDQVLNRSAEVQFTSGEQLLTTYNIQRRPDAIRSSVTFPNNLSNVTTKKSSGIRTTTFADGTEVVTEKNPDPRWGMRAPVEKSTVTTPNGRTLTTATERIAELADPNDLMSLTVLTETTTTNSKTFTKAYDAATQQWTYTSAAGRNSYSNVDNIGRITESWTSGIFPTEILYDQYGRIEYVQTGEVGNLRTYQFTYDERGFLDAVIDPMSRTTSYLNDE